MIRKLLLFAALLLASCAQLGLEKADSTPQRIAYGISTVTDIREQATVMVKAGTLKPADARKVQELADMARLGFEQAKNIYFDPMRASGTGKVDAVRVLETMETLLVNAQGILLTAQKK